MTLEDLKIFQIVGHSESMSEVARKLGCSQPAISQHIARLEKEFQISLLERGKRGITLTEPGYFLLQRVEEALEAIESAKRKLTAWHLGLTGELRISTGGTTVKHLMKQSVKAFQKEYPSVSLSFHSAPRTESCLSALKEQSVDLAFVTLRREKLGVETKPVARLSWCLVFLEGDHFFQKKSKIALKELEGKKMIGLPKTTDSFQYVERALTQRGIDLNCKTLVDDWEMALLFVELGLGYAILPSIFAVNVPSIRAIPIYDLEPLSVGWIARKFKFLNEPAKIFMGLVEQEVQILSQKVFGLAVSENESS